MRNFLANLAFSARILPKSAIFSISIVLVLAFSIGANSAVFSIIDAVLLQPLPFRDPGRLVMVWEKNPALGPLIGQRVPVAYSNFTEWKRRATQFESIEGFEDANFNLTGGGEPERIAGARASANFFQLLGVNPRFGSGFEASARSVLLSDGFFQSHFGGDRSVLGKALTMNDIVYTVAGVLPPEFHLPATREGQEQRKPDLWVAYDPSLPRDLAELNRRKMQVFARLRPAVSLEQAGAEMNVIAAALAIEDPAENTGFGANIFPLYTEDVGKDQRRNLLVLFGGVAFVLLIACANIANLTLARATARSQEMAIRKAMGAGAAQFFSQLLAESFLLCAAGGIIGLGLAHYGIKALIALKPAGINRPEQIHLGLPVLLFTLGICAIVTLGFGIIPAIRAARLDVNAVMMHTRGAAAGATRGGLRQVFVISEVALACMLLVGALFMIKSLLAVTHIDPGFRPDHLLTMKFSLPESRYKNNEQIAAFCRQTLDKISTLPNVKSASFSDGLPLTRIRMTRFTVENRPAPPPGNEPTADMRGILTPDYLETIGLRLISGRNFTAAEVTDKQPVIIINQTLAHQLWPDENPIGQRIRSVPSKSAPALVVSTVVGIVADTHQTSLEDATRPEIIKPMVDYTQLTLEVRTQLDPESLVLPVKNRIWAVDKNLPVYEVETMEQIVDSSTSERRFESFLMSVFAALALLLASIGIYGVVASLVAQRTNEIGVRMALGAGPIDIVRLIFGEGLRMVIIGLIVGTAGGIALTRLLGGLFFGVDLGNAVTYAEVISTIAVIGILACTLPAWRAIRLNPIEALRCE